MNPRISIITVTYNAASVLDYTMQSVRNQGYKNIEYIIVDGASKDQTVEIIKQNEGVVNRWISEPDKGIYDAMNKGLQMATGEYVWFINAGDEIFAHDTVTKIFENQTTLADIYYGETMLIGEDRQELKMRRLQAPEVLTWKSFKKGMLVCHQSILVRKSIASNYDLSYRVSADVDWVIKALKKAKSIQNAHLTLSRFLQGGFSNVHLKKSLKERFKIMVKHYGWFSTVFYHTYIAFRFVMHFFTGNLKHESL